MTSVYSPNSLRLTTLLSTLPHSLSSLLEKSSITPTSLLLLSFLLAFVTFLWSQRRVSKKGEKGLENIHGPKPLPLLGNLMDVKPDVEEMDDFFVETHAKFKKRAKFTILGQNFVILYNAADLKAVLHTKNHMQKSEEYKVFKWIGDGVLTADSSLWLQTRPVLDIGFRQTMLNQYRTVFCAKSQQLCAHLHEKISKDPSAFNIFPLIFDTGFDIIMGTVMGENVNSLDGVDDNVYSTNMDRAADFFHYLHWRPFYHKTKIGRFLWDRSADGKECNEVMGRLNRFSEALLQKRKAAIEHYDEEESRNATSLLDIMLIEQKRNPGLWTDKQIRDEIDTFLTGGHGATTATFGMFIQLMAQFPEAQEKCFQEISSIFDGDGQKELTMEDLSKLKYTEKCLKECLRLYPGVPIFPRQVIRPLTLGDETKVPVGTTLLIVPFLLHRDEDYFPDPEAFIPERWDVESPYYREKHPYAFAPFSAGPRNCIGKGFSMVEMKVYIAYLIYNFRVHKVRDREDMKVLLRIFLKSKDGIRVRLEGRSHTRS